MPDLPKNTYEVVLETRALGAIGLFEPKIFRLRAWSREQAAHWAIDDAHDLTLETRGVISIEKLS